LDEPLRERLKYLAAEYPRYGYLMLHRLLKAEGLVVNRKRTYRLIPKNLFRFALKSERGFSVLAGQWIL